jgi:hypothetical protein
MLTKEKVIIRVLETLQQIPARWHMQQYIACLIIRDVISSLVQIALQNQDHQSGTETDGTTNLLSSRYREVNRFCQSFRNK